MHHDVDEAVSYRWSTTSSEPKATSAGQNAPVLSTHPVGINSYTSKMYSPESQGTRSWTTIIVHCLTTLLPASYIVLRSDLIASSRRRNIIQVARLLFGLLVPQLVLFAAVTEFGQAYLITTRVNRAIEKAHLQTPPQAPVNNDEQNRWRHWQSNFIGAEWFGRTIIAWERMTQKIKVVWRRIFSSKPEYYELVSS